MKCLEDTYMTKEIGWMTLLRNDINHKARPPAYNWLIKREIKSRVYLRPPMEEGDHKFLLSEFIKYFGWKYTSRILFARGAKVARLLNSLPSSIGHF